MTLNLFDIVSTFLQEEKFLLLFDIANLNFDTFLLFYYCLGIMLVPKYCVGIVWSPKKVIPRISVPSAHHHQQDTGCTALRSLVNNLLDETLSLVHKNADRWRA